MFIKILLELVQEFCKFCCAWLWHKSFLAPMCLTVEQFGFSDAVPALDHLVKFRAALDA